MSRTSYDAEKMTLTVDDEGIAKALGELKGKTPAVLKVAINATARQAARDAIKASENRYALTERGRAKLKEYKQRKRATNSSLVATLHGNDESKSLNLVYFEHSPTKPFMGLRVGFAPKHFTARVLKNGGTYELKEEQGKKSKGFLVDIKNPKSGSNHLAIVQRVLNSYTENHTTRRGYPRWTTGNENGDVEKIYDMQRPGVTGMGSVVWNRGVREEAEKNLEYFVERRINQILDKAARKG